MKRAGCVEQRVVMSCHVISSTLSFLRESALETQRLRERCLHLEDLLAATTSKNTLLEEVRRVVSCLSKVLSGVSNDASQSFCGT